MRVLETTVSEMKVECEEATIPSDTDVIAKESNNAINNVELNFSTKKVATERIKQAVAEPIMARLEQLQARLDEITMRDGKLMDVSDSDTRMNRGSLCQKSVHREPRTLDKMTCFTKLREGLGPNA